MNNEIEYNMDDLANIFRCTRCEAVQIVRREGITNHRRFGNTFVYEIDVVQYLMRRHRETQGEEYRYDEG